MCMRASGASELRKFGIFTFLNCYFFQYFVGIYTSDTLSVQMTCLSAYMYRHNSKCTDKTPKKHYLGGGQLPPCPPLATLMLYPHPSLPVYSHYQAVTFQTWSGQLSKEHNNTFARVWRIFDVIAYSCFTDPLVPHFMVRTKLCLRGLFTFW